MKTTKPVINTKSKHKGHGANNRTTTISRKCSETKQTPQDRNNNMEHI
jgi:hypothetical protein